MKYATYSANGQVHYGAVTDDGMIALDGDFPQWPTLLEAVQAGGLDALGAAAKGKSVTHSDFEFEMVLPNAPRILCVGVNFPDRNAEYKDGSEQPKYMSLFPRFASGFTGHNRPLIRPPENETLDYEGEVAIVIGKTGRRITQGDLAPRPPRCSRKGPCGLCQQLVGNLSARYGVSADHHGPTTDRSEFSIGQNYSYDNDAP